MLRQFYKEIDMSNLTNIGIFFFGFFGGLGVFFLGINALWKTSILDREKKLERR